MWLGFWSAFLYNQWCWASFHVHINHFCTFFGEIAVLFSFFFFLILKLDYSVSFLSFKNSLYILDISYLSDIWLAGTFSQSMAYLFTFLKGIFWSKKRESERTFDLSKPSLSFFLSNLGIFCCEMYDCIIFERSFFHWIYNFRLTVLLLFFLVLLKYCSTVLTNLSYFCSLCNVFFPPGSS